MIGSRFLPAVLLGPVLAGCGKELTAGGYREGPVQTVVADSPSSASAARLNRNVFNGERVGAATATLSGTIEVRLSAALIDADGTATAVADEALANLAIGGTQSVQIGFRTVEAKRYGAVRIVISSLAAEVQGLSIGGITFDGSVGVALQGVGLILDVPLTVDVREDETTRLRIDMNSGDWLATATVRPGTVPPTAVVAAAAVESAIRVTAE